MERRMPVMEEKIKTLASFVRSNRLKKGLNFTQLANELGLTAMYIIDLENGKRIPQKGKALDALSEYFNVPLEQIKTLAALSKSETYKNEKDGKEMLELKLVLARRLFENSDMDKKTIQNWLKEIG